MRKLLYVLLFLSAAVSTRSAEHLGTIRVAIENPTAEARPASDIVLSIAELRKVAPGFSPGALFVTCAPDSASSDAKGEREELPSQVDDLDGDGKGDELAFQIDLAPRQKRIVTITYGGPDQILRMRHSYPQRTDALFSHKIEGLGWESDRIAFRAYFDPRNAIDIYGKHRRTLQLRLYASPDYPYHEESPEGRDIFKVGESIGIGGVGGWVNGRIVKAADVKERKWRIVSTGPVRTIVELEYVAWNLGAQTVTMTSHITQWAGEHGFYHCIAVVPPAALAFATGFPAKHGVTLAKSLSASPGDIAWLASWGEQVVAPGPTATEAIHGQNLGLAVLVEAQPMQCVENSVDDLLTFTLRDGTATWYAMAAWDREDTEQVPPPAVSGAITTNDSFLAAVKGQSSRMRSPTIVKILTGTESD